MTKATNRVTGPKKIPKDGLSETRYRLSMKTFMTLLFLPFCAFGNAAHTLQPRAGVTLNIHPLEVKKPSAVLIMMVGGRGFPGLNNPKSDSEENFLVRAKDFFLERDMTLIFPNIPSDRASEGYGKANKEVEFRWSAQHMEDLAAVVKFAKEKYKKEVFIVGSSMGSLSAVAYAIEGKEEISGIVLVSSFMSRNQTPGLARFDVNKVKIPLVLVHHFDDSCGGSKRGEVEGWLMGALTIKDKVYIHGGNATGNPCGPLHHHGFEGKEKDAANAIVDWVNRK